jgi:metal-responsive CopG/Arc/MetJ family transcriptional regulator
MPAKGKTAISLNLDPDLLARIDKYRFKRMFPTRTEAIEFLLDTALKANPERPATNRAAAKGEA